MRTGLALLNQESDDAFDDLTTENMGDVHYDVLEMAFESTLVRECLQRPETKDCYALQFIRSFTMGPMDVEIHDWILAADGDVKLVGKVAQAAELFCPAGPVLRLLLMEARQVESLDSQRGGTITVTHASPLLNPDGILIACESCSLAELHCESVNSDYVLTYV